MYKYVKSVLLLVLVSYSVIAQDHVDTIVREFKNSDSPNVLVAAHRGDWRHAPENSIKGIESCIAMGIDIVEIDVRKTKDGKLVLMHDATIDRTTNGTGKVSDHTLAELKKLYLKDNQGGGDAVLTDLRIATLEEALIAAKGKIMLNLDKSYGLMKDIYPLLIKTGTLNIAIFKGTSPPDQTKRDIAFMDKSTLFMPIVFSDKDDVKESIKSYLKKVHPAAFEVILRKDDALLAESDHIRKHGARVWVNTLWDSLCAGYSDAKAVKDPEANYGHLISKGVNVIQTDNPAELLQYLKDKGLRNF